MEHRKHIEGEEALVILSEFASLIPECPECRNRACINWIKYYIKWVIGNMTNPQGPLGMLIALLKREDGDMVIFTLQELNNSTDTKRVVVEKDAGSNRLRVRIVDKESTRSDFQQEDEEWPTLLLPSGSA